MKYRILLLLALVPLKSFSFTPPYNTLDKTYIDTQGSMHEVAEVSPAKTQDGVGICYGFTSTGLLETYRCQNLNLDCNNPNERLSSFDVTSYYSSNDTRGIEEGGDSYHLLKELSLSSRRIAREECIPFSSIVHQKGNEKKGFLFLISKWNEYKGIKTKQNDCVECLVSGIKSTLVNMKTPADQLKAAFIDSKNVEEFLYKSILPAECLDEKMAANVPPFEVYTYPNSGEVFNDNVFRKKIEGLLLSKTPLEFAICSDKNYTSDCKGQRGHSIILYGIKEVCSKVKKECRTMVRVKNSFGKNWDSMTNNGWVDFKTLRESSLSFYNYFNMTWIAKPGEAPFVAELPKSAGHIDSE